GSINQRTSSLATTLATPLPARGIQTPTSRGAVKGDATITRGGHSHFYALINHPDLEASLNVIT
ncbi:hypothetical protein HAX54_038542, partial [Datura stramonium]|nr:hypothetical protein [Datura stramonium]